MTAIGGSIESISVRGRLFSVLADADATRKLGGFENEVSANGNGTTRTIKTRVPWGLEGVVVEISDVRADQEHLQEVADMNEDVAIAITFASGLTYQAVGTITGEIGASSNGASASPSFSGPGNMSQQ